MLENGDKLDAWMGKVVSEAGGKPTVVVLGDAVPVRRPARVGPEASRYDPHWWHDPRNAIAAVGEIRDALVARRPGARGRPTGANAAAYVAKLHALDRGHRRVLREGARGASASSSPTTTPSATSPPATGSRSSAP